MNLYQLVKDSQNGKEEALEKVLSNFERFIYKRMQQTPKQNQDDLKQELRIIVWEKAINYKLDEVPGFDEFVSKHR